MASVECDRCGITPGDLPYEQMGMTLEEFADLVFVRVGGTVRCQGCAEDGGGDAGALACGA